MQLFIDPSVHCNIQCECDDSIRGLDINKLWAVQFLLGDGDTVTKVSIKDTL